MKYLPYLKQMETLLDEMDEKRKRDLLLEWARKQSEVEREQLLALWNGETEQVNIEEIRSCIDKVMKYEGMIEKTYEEDDEYYYDDSDDDYNTPTFHDPDGILDAINQLIKSGHDCMMNGCYDLACEIYNALFSIQIFVADEFGYTDEMNLSELYSYELLNGSLRTLLLKAIYCIYQTYDGEERMEHILELLRPYERYLDGIEGFMLLGNEGLANLEDFWKQWALYLSNQDHHVNDSLLVEACNNLSGIDSMKEVLMQTNYRHPELAVSLCKQLYEEGQIEQSLKEALFTIRKINRASDVCLTLVEDQLKWQKSDVLKPYKIELMETLFVSNPIVEHYMLYRYSGVSQEQFLKRYHMVMDGVENESYSGGYGDRLFANAYLIRLLQGEVQSVYDECIGKYAKQRLRDCIQADIVPFALVMLYQGEVIPKYLSDWIKGGMKYEETISCFNTWKKEVLLNEHQKEQWLNWLIPYCEYETSSVLESKHRSAYWLVARLIVGLGLVLDSYERISFEQFVSSYQNKYCKYSRFVKELKEYQNRV